jgi:diguanylate cyclase (GGDEF)-like protein
VNVLSTIAHEAPEIEAMFEVELLDQRRSEWVLQEAREVLVFRNLQMVQESTQLREVAASLKAQALALEEKSKRDNLTGAFNRGHLDATLVEWFSEASRDGTLLSLVFVDLDDFKKVNDLHGHHVGDAVLMRFGEVLHRVVRGSDMVARYGGEEFVVLLRECGADGARRFCSRLQRLSRAVTHDVETGEPLRVTASMGIATHGESAFFGSCAEMMRAADEALYRAKQAGKDRYAEHGARAHAA